MKVIVYKVTAPSLLAWPPGNVTLHVSFSPEDAERYIRDYPNMFMRPLMRIEPSEADYIETD
jgi:hypothetical protein